MKIVVLCLVACLSLSTAQGQLWNEWFRQEKTALRYSAEQIAALRTYAGALQKGYAIVRDGLQTIDAIKKGDFLQHLSYITGLRQINPLVEGYGKGAAILAIQLQTNKVFDQYRAFTMKTNLLQPGEKLYGQEVFQKITESAEELVRQLHVVLKEDCLAMDDAARLERMDIIHQQMADIYAFARHFEEGFRLLAGQRQQGQKEGKVLHQFSLK